MYTHIVTYKISKYIDNIDRCIDMYVDIDIDIYTHIVTYRISRYIDV